MEEYNGNKKGGADSSKIKAGWVSVNLKLGPSCKPCCHGNKLSYLFWPFHYV